MQSASPTPSVAIAGGGTGGHLLPGLAVARVLRQRGAAVRMLITPKEVDQQIARETPDLEWFTLPAVALQRGRALAFFRGLASSYGAVRKLFRARRPSAVLAMGGFASAPAVLAAKGLKAATFVHEANAIPGRANRWLAPWVTEVFVNFPMAAPRLHNRSTRVTGMPVRAQFQPGDSGVCRTALGLEPDRPVLLVMGGSQGASGINELMLRALPRLAERARDLQILHLTGPGDAEKVRSAYFIQKRRAVVRPFLAEMELALSAATVAVSRAGASSLAELAAMRVPAILIPYPAAANNHQLCNARTLADAGAARLLEQHRTTPDTLAEAIFELKERPESRAAMGAALARWHEPAAAQKIAERILEVLAGRTGARTVPRVSNPAGAAPAGVPVRHEPTQAELEALLR